MADLEDAGPVDSSVLTEKHLHMSGFIRTLLDLLRQAGFYYISLLRHVQLDQVLLGAMIERWRRETHTFHFRHGEITITLHDIAVISGLHVDGEPVTGTTLHPWSDICQALLGAVPDDIMAGQIRLDWLYQYYYHIQLDAPPLSGVLRPCCR
ncbi:protein MAIN-LIKE 1-like [Ananas comosus]|uniref:Protein MAIN-LIKE 1-like n=1 Tax=Ananas comosus TaxID=4615 RepID=A0A6P5GSV3_ANACO|nr:protein MAIN-LIKE 1-like [Ananas comosus]